MNPPAQWENGRRHWTDIFVLRYAWLIKKKTPSMEKTRRSLSLFSISFPILRIGFIGSPGETTLSIPKIRSHRLAIESTNTRTYCFFCLCPPGRRNFAKTSALRGYFNRWRLILVGLQGFFFWCFLFHLSLGQIPVAPSSDATPTTVFNSVHLTLFRRSP